MKKIISLFLAVLFSISALSADLCKICERHLDEKSIYNPTSKIIGYRKLTKCGHQFHHVCIAFWYLGKQYYNAEFAHCRCFTCGETYHHNYLKGLRKKIRRENGIYKTLKSQIWSNRGRYVELYSRFGGPYEGVSLSELCGFSNIDSDYDSDDSDW